METVYKYHILERELAFPSGKSGEKQTTSTNTQIQNIK